MVKEKYIKEGHSTIYTSEIQQCFILKPTSKDVKNFQISVFNETNTEVFMGVSTLSLSANSGKIFYSSFFNNVFCEIPLNIKAEKDSFIICFKSNKYNKINIIIKEEFENYVSSPNFVTDVIPNLNHNKTLPIALIVFTIIIMLILGLISLHKLGAFSKSYRCRSQSGL